MSDEALRIVEEGLRKQVSYEVIAAKIRAETGEEIGPSSIGRYYAAKFRPREDGRRQANAIADRLAAKLDTLDDDGLRRAVKLQAAEALSPLMEALAAEKPQAVANFFAALDFNAVTQDSNQVRREQLAVRVRQLEADLELERRKLEAIAEKAKAALGKGAPRTRAEKEAAIRAIYGLTVSSPSAAGGALPSSPAAGGAGVQDAQGTFAQTGRGRPADDERPGAAAELDTADEEPDTRSGTAGSLAGSRDRAALKAGRGAIPAVPSMTRGAR